MHAKAEVVEDFQKLAVTNEKPDTANKAIIKKRAQNSQKTPVLQVLSGIQTKRIYDDVDIDERIDKIKDIAH